MESLFLRLSLPQQFAFLLALFSARSFVVAGAGTLYTQLTPWAAARRIIPRASKWSTIRHDMLHGLKILVMDSLTVGTAIHFGFLRVDAGPTIVSSFTTFSLMFLWLEVYFYYSHRLLHKPSLFWIHRHHHEGNLTNPWTSLSFSFAERAVLHLGAVAVPALVSQFWPLSLPAYSFYFFVNYILNVNGHLNVEIMPRWLVLSPFGAVLNTATQHALHHARYKGDYGLFTRTLDRIHGTEFQDYFDTYLAVTGGLGSPLPQSGHHETS
jgi:Delta7-sterol 5-desaturase